MLLTTLLGFVAAQEPMKWTGEVRAFATYASPLLLPEERLNTVYVARKMYEDGTSTTVVRTVKANTPAAFFSANTGEGRIERNRKGLATRYARNLFTRIPAGEQAGHSSYSSLDHPHLQSGAAVAAMRREADLIAMLKPAKDARVVIDPLEALAFPETRAEDGSWKLPMPALSAMTPVDVINLRPLGVQQIRLGPGIRALNVVALFWHQGLVVPAGPQNPEWAPAGYLLYRPSGSLAAFLPINYASPNPSLPLFVDTAQSRRFLHPSEVWGIPFDSSRGVIVPTAVSPADRSAVLESIKQAPKVEGSPDEG